MGPWSLHEQAAVLWLICIDLSTPPIKWVLLSLILNGLRAEQTQYDG